MIPFFPGFVAARFVGEDGVGIHYVTGGSGPPLLLIHGAPQSHVMWRRIAPRLAERFTLVIPDLRGYGRSDKPARGDYSKRRSAADLVALMASLGHARFRAAGHDRGGRVLRRLLKDHRDAVERTVILDIVPTTHIYRTMDHRVASNVWHWLVFALPEPRPERLIDAHAFIASIAPITGDDAGAMADYFATNDTPEAFQAMCEDYRAGATIDIAHDDADADRPIEVPLLLLWGRCSASTGQIFDVPAAWAGEATDIRFGSIDCNHFLPEEAPDETIAEMLAFL